jgi:hypothetical protein
MEEFAALIHGDIFILGVGRGVATEPRSKPCEWCGLCNTGGAVDSRGGVVGK